MHGLNLQYMIRKTRGRGVCLWKFKSLKDQGRLHVSEELGVKMVDVPLWKRMHQQEDRFG